MSGLYTLYVSAPLLFIAVLVLTLSYFTKREDSAYKHFIFLCSTVVAWNIIEMIYTVSVDLNTAEFFFVLQMLVIPYLPVALLMYVLKIAGFHQFASSKYVLLACILPTITVIMNFTNDFHQLFRIYFAIVEVTPVRVFINERGPWFWIHIAYSYAAILLANFVVIYRIKNSMKAERFRYYMILLGSSFSIFSNIIVIFFAPASPIDSTLWGATLGLFFFYFAMDTSLTSNYLFARNQVFESIGEYIFVLDTDESITDINSSARNWLVKHGIFSPITLDMLFSQLRDKGATIELGENEEQGELFFSDEENLLFSSFVIKRNHMYDAKQSYVGTILTLSDMTAIRNTMRNLQEISIIDELTGTYNRRAYEKMLDDYDKADHLPLCVVIGDVNGLKKVNDTLGHASGDHSLRYIAQLLVKCATGHGAVARIGGDEFAIVAPGCNHSAAESLIQTIKEAVTAEVDAIHGAGIALGYAIKTEPHQELSKIIHEADKKMYQDKGNDRRR